MSLLASKLNTDILSEVRKLIPHMDNKDTKEIEAYTSGLINWFRASTFVHLPPNVTGTAPAAPGRVLDLKLVKGKLVPAPESIWIDEIRKLGVHDEKNSKLANEISKTVQYFTKSIEIECINPTGMSSAAPGPPPIPGILTITTANECKISGVSGKGWAEAVIDFSHNTNYAISVFSSILSRIKSDISLSYPDDAIKGIFLQPGTKLIGGNAAGGIIK